jgi:hypothetical protein
MNHSQRQWNTLVPGVLHIMIARETKPLVYSTNTLIQQLVLELELREYIPLFFANHKRLTSHTLAYTVPNVFFQYSSILEFINLLEFIYTLNGESHLSR